MKFSYSLIEFVPSPARGERVNIGAIAGSAESGTWAMRLVSNMKRARALDETGALRGVKDVLAQIEDKLGVTAPGVATDMPSEEWLRALSDRYSNVVQFTPPTPIRADSPEHAIELIFKHLVVDPSPLELGIATKRRAASAARRAYSQYRIPPQSLVERVTVSAGAYRTRCDFAVLNGKALQLTQAWSFQIAPNELEEQVLAWAWVVDAIRQGRESSILAPVRALQVLSSVDVAVIYVPPASGEAERIFAEAKTAFDQIGALAVPTERADVVAARAAELIEDSTRSTNALRA